MTDWSIQQAIEHYRLKQWSAGYFTVNERGNMAVVPDPEQEQLTFDIKDVVDEIRNEGIEFPVVVRFHDILRSRVQQLNRYFAEAIETAEYQGKYFGVFPIKVNQMREVVEEIVDAGRPYNYGLEAGSKAELLSVLAFNDDPDALTICNGYKDEEFLRLAMLGRALQRKVIVVIEKPSEIYPLLKIAKETGIKPIIGIRAKLSVKGKGKWENSSGDRAKFGLTLPEIVNVLQVTKEQGYFDCVKLLHFHIGSQLADITSVQDAVTEAARLYTKMAKYGVELDYLDVGGGLAVDYDGTRSNNESSMNYSLREYINNIVVDVKQICDLEGIPHPNLITESGRAMTAHHSCVITNVLGEISNVKGTVDVSEEEGEHFLVSNMRNYMDNLTAENPVETYHDVTKAREEALNGFKLGIIDLSEMAKIETCYFRALTYIAQMTAHIEEVPDALASLEKELAPQYLCNFSLFQSAADSWAIKQVLPIMPISQLDQQPDRQCTLVDITCDSDGKVNQFVGPNGVEDLLSVHKLEDGKEYYLGLFLTGAYQDVMGDMHNLFGRLNEVHVYCDDDDPSDFYIEEIVHGSTITSVLETMQYHPKMMAATVKKCIDKEVSKGKIRPRQGVKLTDFYEKVIAGYTYFKHE